MKKRIIIASLFIGALTYGQIKTQSKVDVSINQENPFLDASNYVGFDGNVGKGLYFPTTDLKTWEFKTDSIDPETFSTYFDGMIVYNTGEGEPTTEASKGGIRKNLTRGFYYFKNPNQTFPNGSIENGEWVRLGDADVANLYTKNGTITNDREVNLANKKLAFTNGKVGVNTTEPKATLDINGTMRVSELPENVNGEKILVVGENNRIEKRDLAATSPKGVIGGRMGTLQYTVGKKYTCNEKNKDVRIWAVNGVLSCIYYDGNYSDTDYYSSSKKRYGYDWNWSGEVSLLTGNGNRELIMSKMYASAIRLSSTIVSGFSYDGFSEDNRQRTKGYTAAPIQVIDDSEYKP